MPPASTAAAIRCIIFHQAPLPEAVTRFLNAGGVERADSITTGASLDNLAIRKTEIIGVVDEGDAYLSTIANSLRRYQEWRLLPWLVFGEETAYQRRVAVLKLGFWEYLRLDEQERATKKIRATIDFHHHCTVDRHMEGWVSFKAKSEYSFIREVNLFISRLQYMTTLPPGAIEDIQYAFLEIGNNAVEHGNVGDASKTISISYLIFEDKLIIKVEDEGTGFTPSEVKSPVSDEQILEGRGRGLFLVREMMDELQYNERGNVCLMTKRFQPVSESSEPSLNQ